MRAILPFILEMAKYVKDFADDERGQLDPLAIQQVRRLVEWLKGRGRTVFFSSHNISEVERVCDRIGILAGGTLVKVVTSDTWNSEPEGWLEELFASTVTLSDKVDPIRFGEKQ